MRGLVRLFTPSEQDAFRHMANMVVDTRFLQHADKLILARKLR